MQSFVHCKQQNNRVCAQTPLGIQEYVILKGSHCCVIPKTEGFILTPEAGSNI